MWLVDVYNYDKEIKLIFIFWFDIVMQFLYNKKYTRLLRRIKVMIISLEMENLILGSTL